jgi:flagellar protein FliO/FliZ
MQFMTSLFGGSAGTLLNAAFSLGIVLVLIVLGVWGLKLLTRAGENMARNKQRRLVVVDSANVDGKRKVLIIRRDNVEHLIMTGGPQDLVIESGIVAAESPQPRAARPTAPAAPADIATPVTPDRPVSREAVDRLNDLARPAPLRPRTSLRHTNLLRATRQESDVIPIGPALRIDNSAGPSADSANTGSVDTGGQTGLGGRNRFFRSVLRDRG